MQTSQKLQHATMGPGVGAATLPPSTPQIDWLSVSFIIHTLVKSSNICNMIIGFPFTICANSRIGYQVIGCRFPASPSAQTIRLVQFSIIGWMVSCQMTLNCCLQFGNNHTGCHLDQHLPRSRWWVLRVRLYGSEDFK